MKFFIRTIIVILCLSLLLKLSIIIFLHPYIKKKIETLANTSANPYHIALDKVRLSFFLTGIQLSEIKIATDTAILTHNGDINELNGSVEQLSLNGFNFYKAIFNNEFDADEITFANARLSLHVFNTNKSIDEKKSPFKIPGNIHVDVINFSNFDFDLENDKETESIETVAVQKIYLSLREINLKKNDTINLDSVELSLNALQIKAVTRDGFYTVKASMLNYKNSRFSLDTFQLIPNYSNYEFTSRHKVETDCIKILCKGLAIDKFSLSDYLEKKTIVAQSVFIRKLNINAFRDKRQEDDRTKKPMIQDVVYNYPGLIKIDSLEVKNGRVEYIEHTEKATKPGKLFFTQVAAKFYNLTNDTIFKTKKGATVVNCEGALMDKAELNVRITLPLYDENKTIYVKGNLGSIDLKELNPTLENNAFISAKGGVIKSMEFDFSADNNKASGKMILLYNDAQLVSVDGETNENKPKEKIKTFITNTFILKTANPLPGEPVRESIIDFKRDPEKFIFNYCWKAILSGIKSGVGLKPAAKIKSGKRDKQ